MVQGRRGQRGAHHGLSSCSVRRMTAAATDGTEEGSLGPRGSCALAPGITIKGTTGATLMKLGVY